MVHLKGKWKVEEMVHLISMEQGKAVAFAIFNLQARGEMFVTHNDLCLSWNDSRSFT